MEGDYEQKVQELSSEKETLGNEKVVKEKENQGLRGEIGQLKGQVLNQITFMLNHAHLHQLHADNMSKAFVSQSIQ